MCITRWTSSRYYKHMIVLPDNLITLKWRLVVVCDTELRPNISHKLPGGASNGRGLDKLLCNLSTAERRAGSPISFSRLLNAPYPIAFVFRGVVVTHRQALFDLSFEPQRA